MSISASTISHALHGLTQRSSTHPHVPADRGQHFSQLLAAKTDAPAQTGQAQGADAPGALLSTDMLRAMQAIR